MMKIDHIAVACETLDAGRAWVEQSLGVTLLPGGQHARFGTHNLLLGLEEGLYLEVIAIDPTVPDPGRRRWFDLDDFTGAPRVTNWICAADDLSAALAKAPARMGAPFDMKRGALEWQFVGGEEGRLPFGGGFPAMIDWGDSVHPATRLANTGLRLERLVITTPDADALRGALAPLITDRRVEIKQGARSMRAEFASPDGQKVLA
ncbi:VOC family protein [Rhodobacteraceae bacterium D3-12]|nr:VOC family protein [Rhodobacteraceae bacterium D3-12]